MALSVPLSRFTSRVGGGSAFFVRPLRTMMSTKSDQSDGIGFLALLISIAAGFGLLHVMEMVYPSLNQRWNAGTPFLGMIVAGGVFGMFAIFVAYRRFSHARVIAIYSFIGLFVPWAIHFVSKLWEFLRGGGI